MDVMGTASQLHARGHDVLVVVTESALGFIKAAAARHSSNTTAEGLHYVVVNITWREFAPPQPRRAGEVPPPSRFAIPDTWPQSSWFRITAGYDMLQLFQPGVAVMARQLLGNATLMQRLRDFRADAVMSIGLSIGGAVADNTGCLLAHALGAPMLDVSGNTFFSGPLSAPQFGTGLTPRDLATPGGLLLNSASWALNTLAPCWQDLVSLMRLSPESPTAQLRAEQGLPQAASSCAVARRVRGLLGTRQQRCRPLLEVSLASWLVEYPRGVGSHQVVVGGGSARQPQPLSPPDVATFVGDAPAGVVLVAFGTVYGPTLRPEDVHELAHAFAALAPVRVLWPLKPGALPPGLQLSDLPLGPNTKTVGWVDYNDVLGHPHTLAFASHCGLHSIQEAAFHGVPLVALPFQFEQAEHALKLASRGAGLISTQAPAFRRGSKAAVHFTRQHVADTIRQVLTNPSYRRSAQAIGKALQAYAAHRHPYERAADEIELALYSAHAQAATAATAHPNQPHQGHRQEEGLGTRDDEL